MDGTKKPSKFPLFEYVPPATEEDSTLSTVSVQKKKGESDVAEEKVEPTEEPLPWPKDVGSFVGTIMLSVNGGTTYRPLPFEFTAYKSSASSLECSHNIAMSVGGLEVELGLKGMLTSYPSFGNNIEERNPNEEEENFEEGIQPTTKANEEEETPTIENEAATNFNSEEKTDGFGLEMKKMPVKQPINWLFASNDIKIKFKGSNENCSINSVVDGFYNEDTSSIVCNVPEMSNAIEWVEYIKREREKATSVDEEPPVEDDENADEPPPPPPRPDIMDVEIYLAMDGVTFEKIGTISMIPPPLITNIETAEGGAVPGSQVRIIGSGFGVDGAKVRVQVDHVSSGGDFSLQGIVENTEDGNGERIESVVFNAPDVQLEPDQDIINYQCIVEISVDGSTLTDWGMTFLMMPTENEK
jgi:hypothetical protein